MSMMLISKSFMLTRFQLYKRRTLLYLEELRASHGDRLSKETARFTAEADELCRGASAG